MIRAVIFDMDGLLIDSEPYWREAEVATFNALGAPITYEMLDETWGMREDQLIAYWYEKYPWNGKSMAEVEKEIEAWVMRLIKEKGMPKRGVQYIFDFLKTKNIKFALASSSSMALISVVLDRFGIAKFFDVIHSGEFEKLGKPDPAIYLTTLDKLEVAPQDTIAFEDSKSGVMAAKAAGVTCIAVPEVVDNLPAGKAGEKFAIADYILSSLDQFDEKMWEEVSRK